MRMGYVPVLGGLSRVEQLLVSFLCLSHYAMVAVLDLTLPHSHIFGEAPSSTGGVAFGM